MPSAFNVWPSGLLGAWPDRLELVTRHSAWYDAFAWKLPASFQNSSFQFTSVHNSLPLYDYPPYKFLTNVACPVNIAIPTSLSTLHSMIGSCQTNVDWSKVTLDCPGVMWLVWSAVPVPCQRGHTVSTDSSVIYGQIGMCNVAAELEMSGTYDVWRLVTGQYVSRALH